MSTLLRLGNLTIKYVSDGAQYILIKLLASLYLLKYYNYYFSKLFSPEQLVSRV